ncbi:MAG: hypothetical protein ACK5LL_07280 [Suipraeoptans sp.]
MDTATSGMNRGRYVLRLIVISAALYLTLGILIFVNLYSFRQTYRSEEQRHVIQIKEEIDDALHNEDMLDSLDQVVANYAVEIVLLDDSLNPVYETVELKEGQKLQNVLNENAKFEEAGGEVAIDGKQYYLWYVIYRVPFIKQLETFVTRQNVIFGMAFMIIFVLLIGFQRSLLSPLYRVAKSIDKAEKNQLDYSEEDYSKDDDPLSKRVKNYMVKQKKVIKKVNKINTELEVSLGIERQRMEDTLQLTKALVHDLKNPIQQKMIETELNLKKNDYNEAEITTKKEYIKMLQDLLGDINGILRVIRNDPYRIRYVSEELDAVEAMTRTRAHYKPEMSEKDLFFSLEADEEVLFYQNKVGVQLLFHNIFSNMVHYCEKETELSASISMKDDVLEVITKNYSNKFNIEKMRESDNPENVITKTYTPGNNKYGSGYGMYLIKDLAMVLGGEYSFTIEEDVVTGNLRLPSKKED